MKKTLLLLLVLFIATAAFAFSRGTMNIGGDVSYTKYKTKSHYDGYTVLSVNPVFGIMLTPTLSLDINLEYRNLDNKIYRENDIGIGGGARYFQDAGPGKLYGGGNLLVLIKKSQWGYWGYWDKYEDRYSFLNLKVGYLLPMTDCLFLDAGVNYKADVEYLDDPLYEARLGLQFFTKSLIPRLKRSSPSYDYDYDYDYDYNYDY